MRLFSPENRSRYSEAGSSTLFRGWVVHTLEVPFILSLLTCKAKMQDQKKRQIGV